MPAAPGIGNSPDAGNGSATPTATAAKGTVQDFSGDGMNTVPDTHIRQLSNDQGETPPEPTNVRASAGSQTMQVSTTTVEGEPALVLEDDRTHSGRWVSVSTKWMQEVHGSVPETVTIRHESGDTYAADVEVREDSAAFYVREFSSNTVTFSGEVQINGDPAQDGSEFTYDINDLDSASEPSINLTGVTATENETQTATITNGGSMSVSLAGNAEPTGPSANNEPTVTLTGYPGDSEIVVEDDGNLTAVDADGSTTNLGISARGVGGVGDFDGDGTVDTVFEQNGVIKWTDGSTVESTGVSVDYTTLSALADFDGDGSLEVMFHDTSDNIKYVGADGTVTDTGANVGPDGPAGVGDLDGDGVPEVAFISTDNIIKWVGADGTVGSTGATTDSYGKIGAVGDIDSDGTLEITYVDDGDFIRTTTPSGTTTGLTTTSSGNDLGPELVDIDDDGDLEQPFSVDGGVKHVDASGNVGTVNGTLSYAGMGGYGNADNDGTKNPSVDIDGDGTDEVSVDGKHTGSQTFEVANLTTADESWDVSVSGTVDVTLNVTERTVTKDPAVELNGVVYQYDGLLADGAVAELTANQSDLREGTNTVNVSVGDGSLSSDAPTPSVALDYSHDASGAKTVTYTGGQWRESYNVSKSYASNRTNAALTIPFQTDVIKLSTVEYRVDDGSWQTATYTLDGTTATVELGNVSAGETIDVRATGSAVNVIDGEITVTEPTPPGEPLNSTISIDSAGDRPRIETANDTLLYVDADAPDTSYEPADRMVYDQQSPGQRLHLDNVTGGETAQIKSLPVNVTPRSGAVELTVVDANRSAPEFQVRPSDSEGDTVEYTFRNTEDGEEYILYSTSEGVQRDSATASSPVTLVDDDSSETLAILLGSSSTSSGGGGGGGGGGGPLVVEAGPLSQIDADLTGPLLIISAVVAFGLLLWLGRRFDLVDTGDRGDTVVETARSTANTLLANEAVVGGVVVIGAIAVWRYALIPPETATVGVLAAIPAGIFLALRQLGGANPDIRVVAGSSAVALVLGTEVLAPGTLGAAVQRLAGGLDPVLPLLAIGGIALAWRAVSAWRSEASTPDRVTEVDFQIQDSGGGSDD